MTRKLKVLGLALLATSAMGAVAAEAATAVVDHEFRSEGNTVLTGNNLGLEKFALGSAGTVECTTSEFEGTQVGAAADKITVTPRVSGCSFGGQIALVNFNHCAYVFDSETTSGNPDGGEHVNVEIECEAESKIEVDTSVCTLTIGAQTINHAVRFGKDTANSTTVFHTSKKVVTGKAKTTGGQTGCLLFPTGAVGAYTGTTTMSCFKNEGSELSGTEKTTPQGLTKEGAPTNCSVS